MVSGGGGESEKILMFCKIHCPFICFCKPSPHIYTTRPLKLDNQLVSVPDDDKDEIFDDPHQYQSQSPSPEVCLKSNLKKPNAGKNKKKRVQWMDVLGKQLVEIREFESCEMEDGKYGAEEMNTSCICVIS